jgi:hypothetical protein
VILRGNSSKNVHKNAQNIGGNIKKRTKNFENGGENILQ